MLPGNFIYDGTVLARASRHLPDAARFQAAFTIGDERSFEQDPRFGLVVMTEIASRALSAATNDSGTALDVVGRTIRLLTLWTKRQQSERCTGYRNLPKPSGRRDGRLRKVRSGGLKGNMITLGSPDSLHKPCRGIAGRAGCRASARCK